MNVDELVVVLGLDAKNFSRDQRAALDEFKKTSEEFDKRLAGLEARNKKTTESFGDMSAAAEGLFTTLAGVGLASFARDAVNTAAATGRMATNIGVATNELSAFGRMIERNGGNADAAAASMKNLVDQQQRAKWGQASPEFLMGMSQVGGTLDDDPITMFMKLAKFSEKNSVQDTNLTGQRLGLSQDVINTALKGGAQALREYKAAADGALSPEQTKKLTDLQNAWAGLGQTVYSVGTAVVANSAPFFTRAATAVTEWTNNNRALADSLGTVLSALASLALLKPAGWLLRMLGLGGVVTGVGAAAGVARGAMRGGAVGLALAVPGIIKADSQNGNPIRTYLRGKLGIPDPGEAASWPGAKPGGGGPSGGGSGAFKDLGEKEAYIRNIATQLGIDPNVAMQVAKNEGFFSFKSMVPGETSYGAFQLNVTPGGRKNHVGDQFRKATGLDPSDPATEREGILFALQDVKKNGWSAYHGAKNNGIGKWDGVGQGDVNIGSIVLPGVSDAKSFAQQLPGAIKQQQQLGRDVANNANTGIRP